MTVLVEVVRLAPLTTVTFVGSPTCGVRGSSEGAGWARFVALTKAWLAMTVPLSSGDTTRAVRVRVWSPPGDSPTSPRGQVTVRVAAS